MKTVEQKLYEAFREGRGLRLSANEVDDLVRPDDAIGTRITNAACGEAGVEQLGHDAVARGGRVMTWPAFVKWLKLADSEVARMTPRLPALDGLHHGPAYRNDTFDRSIQAYPV